MCHKFIRIFSVIAVVLLALGLTAQIVMAYLFVAPISVQETNGTVYTQIATQDTLATKWLISHGYIDSNGLDTDISPDKPHMIANDRLLLSTALPAFGQVNVNLTTGNTPATYMPVIVGQGGSISVIDNAAMELGNNFEIEVDGYIETSAGASKNIVYKQNAFQTTISAVSTITSTILSLTQSLLPNGAGDYTNIASANPAVAHYLNVDDPVAAPDDAATVVYNNAAAYQGDVYALQNGTFGGDEIIDSVTINYRGLTTIGGTTVQPILRLGGVETLGTEVNYGAAWTNYSEVLARPGGGSWTVADIAGLQAGIQCKTTNTSPDTTQVYVTIAYHIEVTHALTSGEHIVKTTADGTNLKLYIDGTEEDSALLGGSSVNNNANNWTIDQTNVMPYVDYYKHTVGGVLIAHYQPNTIVGGQVYSAGTVTVTNGDATVTGAGGAAWTTVMESGLFKSADGIYYTISSVTSATTLELSTVYGGGTLAGQAYNMYVKLPDRQGTEQPGLITWGANPAGVAMSIGSLSGYSGAFTDTSDDTPSDRLPEVPVTDWYGDGTITKAATLANPLRGLVTMVSDNTDLTEIQTWRWYGMILLVMCTAVFAKFARGHQGITAIAAGAIIGFLIAFDSTIFPLYLAVLSAGLIIGGLISERSHQI